MRKRVEYIDALRGVAIFLVVVIHVSQYGRHITNDTLLSIINFGMFGVQLFFMVSAFTLFLTSSRFKYTGPDGWGKFYLKRYLRLAPLYYLGIIFYLALNNIVREYGINDATANTVANLTFLHGVNPYWINSLVPGGWSITIEFMFYMIFPIIFRFVTSFNRAVLFFLVSLIFGVILNSVLFENPPIADAALWQDFLYFWFPNQLAVFALGAVLYFFIQVDGYRLSKRSVGLILLCGTIALFAHKTFWPAIIPHHVWTSLVLAGVFLFFSLYEQHIPRLVMNYLGFLGRISYGVYLSHFAVLIILSRMDLVRYTGFAGPDFLIRLVITLPISMAAAYILHRCVEIPYQQVAKRLG